MIFENMMTFIGPKDFRVRKSKITGPMNPKMGTLIPLIISRTGANISFSTSMQVVSVEDSRFYNQVF